jgi:hypothetical protein
MIAQGIALGRSMHPNANALKGRNRSGNRRSIPKGTLGVAQGFPVWPLQGRLRQAMTGPTGAVSDPKHAFKPVPPGAARAFTGGTMNLPCPFGGAVYRSPYRHRV